MGDRERRRLSKIFQRARADSLPPLSVLRPEIPEYVSAAVAAMPKEKQLRLAAQLLDQLNKEKEATG